MHEDAAHDVGDQNARAVPGQVDAGAAAGRALGIIGGAQEAVLARGECQRLALVPDMIAGGDDIGACGERGLENLFRDAETAGRVLAVDDDEIEPEIGNQAGKLLPHRRPPRFAHHVAEKEKSHGSSIEADRSGATRLRSRFRE